MRNTKYIASFLRCIPVIVFSFCAMECIYRQDVYAADCETIHVDNKCPDGYETKSDSECGYVPINYRCCCPKSSGDLSSNEIPNPTALENIGDLITKASSLIPPFAILGFVGSVIYAGFVRMTAAGNPEKEAKSMKIAIAAAIGFAIIALAPLLVKLISGFLNVEETIT